jgi:tetratricopeptide (TPR) repeat protein
VFYDKLGKRDESIARMKRVLRQTPDDPQALNYLGYTYAEMGTNLDEALQYLKKAVALKPGDGAILDSLGWVYFKQKRYEDAVITLEKAHQLVNDDPTIMEHLADAHAARRDIKKALPLYRQILKLEPGRRDIAEKIRKIKAESVER